MLNKTLIITSFLLVGLTFSIATIFNVENSYYFDVSITLAYLISTILNTSLIIEKNISVNYKYLSVGILLFVVWNTIFYFLFYYFYKINVIFYVLQVSSLLILLLYALRKSYFYKTKK